MKTTKKIVSLLLALMLVLMWVPAVYAAGSGAMAVKADKAETPRNELVNFTVNLTKNPGIMGCTLTVSYDSAKLELQALSADGISTSGMCNVNGTTMAWVNSSNVKTTGSIAKITFKAKSDAELGATSVSVTLTAYDHDEQPVTFNTTSGSTKIAVAKHTCSGGTATCTKKAVCTICGKEYGSLKAHTYGKWTETAKATCEGKGEQSRACTVCGKAEVRYLDPLGHKFGESVVLEEATCAKEGLAEGTCKVCGKKVTQPIEMKEHDYGEWTDKKSATCDKAGLQTHVCKVCGGGEDRAVPALGHNFGSEEIIEDYTITTTGVSKKTCTRCGKSIETTTPCGYLDKKNGIKLEMEEGIFTKGTEIKTEMISGGNEHKQIQQLLSDVGGKFMAFSISGKKDGTAVEPNGIVTVRYTLPGGSYANIQVFAINNGVKEPVSSIMADEGKAVEFEIEKFGTFAVVQSGSTAGKGDEQNTNATTDDGNINIIWFILLGILVLGGTNFATYFFTRRKYCDDPIDLLNFKPGKKNLFEEEDE